MDLYYLRYLPFYATPPGARLPPPMGAEVQATAENARRTGSYGEFRGYYSSIASWNVSFLQAPARIWDEMGASIPSPIPNTPDSPALMVQVTIEQLLQATLNSYRCDVREVDERLDTENARLLAEERRVTEAYHAAPISVSRRFRRRPVRCSAALETDRVWVLIIHQVLCNIRNPNWWREMQQQWNVPLSHADKFKMERLMLIYHGLEPHINSLVKDFARRRERKEMMYRECLVLTRQLVEELRQFLAREGLYAAEPDYP
ncbi:hypothetical protein F5Y08DRAFT_323242 [Xylaria arbuscula]|nr:hypothetical protein F5Y08DRAFT_323242 [Xylaria arbuscula]